MKIRLAPLCALALAVLLHVASPVFAAIAPAQCTGITQGVVWTPAQWIACFGSLQPVGLADIETVGAGLTLGGGALSANVTSVMGRTGAVVLQSSDIAGALGYALTLGGAVDITGAFTGLPIGITGTFTANDGVVATGAGTIGDASGAAPLFPLGLTSGAAITAQNMPGTGITATQSYLRFSESGGLNTNTWLNAPLDFDLTNVSNNAKRGLTMDVRTTILDGNDKHRRYRDFDLHTARQWRRYKRYLD